MQRLDRADLVFLLRALAYILTVAGLGIAVLALSAFAGLCVRVFLWGLSG